MASDIRRGTTETSPLLGSSGRGSINGHHNINPPTTDTGEVTTTESGSESTNGFGDVEGRASVEEETRTAQFAGASPEIQGRLKYILPSLAIGVSRVERHTHTHTHKPFYRMGEGVASRANKCCSWLIIIVGRYFSRRLIRSLSPPAVGPSAAT